jgi:hypothetical protein
MLYSTSSSKSPYSFFRRRVLAVAVVEELAVLLLPVLEHVVGPFLEELHALVVRHLKDLAMVVRIATAPAGEILADQ